MLHAIKCLSKIDNLGGDGWGIDFFSVLTIFVFFKTNYIKRFRCTCTENKWKVSGNSHLNLINFSDSSNSILILCHRR